MFKEYKKFIKEYLELAEIKTIYLVVNIFSAFFYKGFSILLPLMASMIVKFLAIHDAEKTYLFLALFLGVYLLYSLALYINYKVYAFNMSYARERMHDKIFKKIISVDNDFTRKISKGRLMNSVNSDVVEVGDMNDRLSETLAGIVQIGAVIIIVAMFNWLIALVLVLFTVLRVNVMNRYDRKTAFYHNKVVAQEDRFSNLVAQAMAGLSEIKTFNMLPKLLGKLDVAQGRHEKLYRMRRRYLTRRDNDTDLIIYAFRATLYLVLIWLMSIGKAELNEVVLVVSYHEYLTTYIDDLIASTMAIRETSIAVERINAILDYESKRKEYGDLTRDNIVGNIELKNVSLRLDGEDLLRNINLKIRQNEVVVITGEAGSGKTMLFNLMLRLVAPTKGKVLLDKVEVHEFTKEVYASNVSVAGQKPFIFNMSIRKNLDFVDTDIERQIDACKKAGIHDFIQTLPKGYNTLLRENAGNISGGQKQMISIARTILSDAEILLLDDITAALDPDTAKLVPRLVRNLRADGRTVIMATKKPDLMKIADRVVVLKKGRIVAQGTHAQLMRVSGDYRDLQSRKSSSRPKEEINV